MRNLIVFVVSIFCPMILIADDVDFCKLSKSNLGKDLVSIEKWQSLNRGECAKFVKGGVNFSVDKNSMSSSVKYGKAFSIADLPITVCVDLTYEQVSTSRGKDLLLLGFKSSKNEVTGKFTRYGYGNYSILSSGKMIKGAAVELEKIGFKTNDSIGKSNLIKFSITLEKNKDGTLALYTALNSTDKNGEITKWGFLREDLDFKLSSNDKFYAFIQNGSSDKIAGVKNRIITNFDVSKKPADKVYVYIPDDIDFRKYILPMTPVKPLVKEGVWGKELLPRDTSNGLESAKSIPDYCYWDGSIVKSDDGKYHIYGCRWDQNNSHSNGWRIASKGIHAVSENLFGPYKDKGVVYPQWNEGKGSNVVGCRTFDGKYAVITSEITRGEIFIGDTPDGPFEFAGEIKIDLNGFKAGLVRYDGGKGNMSNVQICKRPDGKYMLIPRNACVLISEGQDIVGPYKVMTGRIFEGLKGVPQRCMEDPTAWYSGGMYHMLINHWMTDCTYYFSSIDGINDWKYRGIAFKKHTGMFRYTDGTQNDWAIVQRPTVYVEDGHCKAILFSVLDITKGMDAPNDAHGSKIIVVPFDGKNFDKAMQKVVAKEK